MKRIAVLGAGGWGIALAKTVYENGCTVRLWEFDKKACEQLLALREAKERLPGITIPKAIEVTNALNQAVEGMELVLLVVPSQVLRSTAKQLAGLILPDEVNFLIASKGLEVGTLVPMVNVLKQEVGKANDMNTAVLTGPSHAEEVGRQMPTTVVVASKNIDLAKEIQETFSNRTLRIYTNADVLGVELAGSLKNVIAIATGISDGLGYGDNAKGALLTRGIVEIARLGKAMGAQDTTFLGLAGIGDLITTCISRHSRNRYVGEEIGKGKTLQQVLDHMVMVAEGVETTKSAYDLARKHQVEMPITEQVYKVLFENKNPSKAVDELMLRLYRSEGE